MFSSLRKLVHSTKVQAAKRTARGHTKSLLLTPRAGAAEARQLMADLKLKSIRELLQALLAPSANLAKPPISQFHVGAVGMTPAGDIYVGVNLEFKEMPLNNSVHAEQFLVANLRHHQETELSVVAVNAAPCGHCRQFFSELQCADRVEFVFGDNGKGSYKLNQLLPMRFKPQDLLGEDPPPLLLSPQNLPLQYSLDTKLAISQRSVDNPVFSKASQLALQEARESYCHYSNCPAGVALITEHGEVYGGGYMESCAYNPSMQALQTALAHATIGGMPEYTQIREAIVAEIPGSAVAHASAVRSLLASIAPSAQVTELNLFKASSVSA